MSEQVIKVLLKVAEANGIQPYDLDAWVADVKRSEAAAINNDGMEAQIRYLLESGHDASDIEENLYIQDGKTSADFIPGGINSLEQQ